MKIHINLSSAEAAYVAKLISVGLWGTTMEAVAHELVRAGIRNSVERGFIRAMDEEERGMVKLPYGVMG